MQLAITLGIIEAFCMALAAGEVNSALGHQGLVKVMAFEGRTMHIHIPGGGGQIKLYCFTKIMITSIDSH